MLAELRQVAVSAPGVQGDPRRSHKQQAWIVQDLLMEHDVPAIPGVTTPMTYIGMWKVCRPPA